MDASGSVVDNWEAEVKCQKCERKRWVLYSRRHEGTKKNDDTTFASINERCSVCPKGQDWTEWTGQKRIKP